MARGRPTSLYPQTTTSCEKQEQSTAPSHAMPTPSHHQSVPSPCCPFLLFAQLQEPTQHSFPVPKTKKRAYPPLFPTPATCFHMFNSKISRFGVWACIIGVLVHLG